MKHRHLAAVAVGAMVALSLAACSNPPPPAVDKAKIAAAVKADWAGVLAAFNAHDAEKAVAHDAPDIVNMTHGQANLVGIDADLKNDKDTFAAGPTTAAFANETVDVADAGDMAVYRATYVWTFTDLKTKAPVTENGNALVGYRKQADGAWKIEWTVLSDTAPAPAPAATS